MTTPLRRQYLEIKRRFPQAIVFFRLGDFYETFDQDAELVSRELDIVLTSRPIGKGQRVPLAGIPHHALDGYLAKLIAKGHKVAICEQVSDATKGPVLSLPKEPVLSGAKGRTLMERQVVRVVTPGTVVEGGLLDQRANNYLAALAVEGERAGIAYVDVSTGEFAVAQIDADLLPAELDRLRPAELVLPEGQGPPEGLQAAVSHLETHRFEPEAAGELLLAHFGAASLDAFGCADQPLAVAAAGAVLAYLQENQRGVLGHITRLSTYSASAFMTLDSQTRRNLELFASVRHGPGTASLLSAIDLTKASMGARLLRRWLGQPLLDIKELAQRQDRVQFFFESAVRRGQVASLLAKMPDLERLLGRISADMASPREVVSLRRGLELVPSLRQAIGDDREEGAEASALLARLHPCQETAALIEQAIADEPAASFEEGGVIRAGFSPELDSLRSVARDARQYLADLERRERQQTGIKSLKVSYNKVFGYYIEVSKANLRLVPAHYQRRQTLVGGERFTTSELKEREFQILHARERQEELEASLFRQVCAQVAAEGKRILELAAAIAETDVFCALAEVAARYGYVRPEVTQDDELVIRDGRHPVVERMLPQGVFVPNDTHLSNQDAQIIVLTGPNMAGKSTYIRQVALIVLLAQMGSFVPAASARIGIVDRIFTRVGALDDIAAGQSTFLVEMLETANILHNATPRSLLLFDEIGRGTSTYDGMAIARAVVEFIHHRPEVAAKTLFATHYHELVDLAAFLPRVKNCNVAVSEEEGRVVFLHRILPGGADKSYGVHVAQLAGLPRPVIQRAQEVLSELEDKGDRLPRRRRPFDKLRAGPREAAVQLSFLGASDAVLEELASLDVDSLTPLQAITKLYELRERARGVNDKGSSPLTANPSPSIVGPESDSLVGRATPMTTTEPSTAAPLVEGLTAPQPDPHSWDFSSVDTQQGVHGLHTYLAAMIPQLARRLIDVYVRRGGSLLDPFCGGGAVPAEATMAGGHATGCDVNDLAVLISKAKTTHIPTDDILGATSAILDEARDFDGEPLSFRPSDYVDFWFKPYMLKPLTAIKAAIDQVLPDDCPLRTLFLTVFSATVRDVSLTRRNEIRLRRMPPKDVEAFRPDILGRFSARARYAASVVPELPARATADVCKGNVLHLPFPDREFDCIICSPPYGDERNGVPYIQFAKNMLLWLGFTREQILASKKETLGWNKEKTRLPPSPTLHAYLERISHNQQSVREALAFYGDYLEALHQMARVVSKRIVIVIGNRVLQNTVFDNAQITIELFESIGVTLEDRFARRLPTKRLPRMRQFGAAIDREDILIFGL